MDFATISLIEIEVLEVNFNDEFFILKEYDDNASWLLLDYFSIESKTYKSIVANQAFKSF